MSNSVYIEIAKLFIRQTFSTKGLSVLFVLYIFLLGLAAYNGWSAYESRHDAIHHHTEAARDSWEGNPDKHPHRMAHFGTFVFRAQHPLSIFDTGIENYTGNAVFLEAHKQNPAKFSEASLSTGLVRIGDLNIAMLLQLILPLIIFFLGYATISAEKENGILRMMYAQGISMRKIIAGKSLGLFLISALFFIPALLILLAIVFTSEGINDIDMIPRVALLANSYILYFLILSMITVIVSAKSKSSTRSLLILLGAWLLLCIVLPKSAQVIGHTLYPNLSKIEFKAAVEAEVSRRGDSHNPDDPYFNNLRDSLLLAYNVTDVRDLPINYSGFVMSKGEEQSSIIYEEEHQKLIQSYRNQNKLTKVFALVNPYIAIRNLSQGLAATNFDTYVHFLNQVEKFRYDQSQYLNNLQIKHISNKATSSEGKINVVGKENWKNMPQFQYEFHSVTDVMQLQCYAKFSLFLWVCGCLIAIFYFYKSSNII